MKSRPIVGGIINDKYRCGGREEEGWIEPVVLWVRNDRNNLGIASGELVEENGEK